MSDPVYRTDFADLTLVHRGKVRDLYQVEDYLLMVAADRISAYDVVMDEPIPGKGEILTAMSLFWFAYLGDILPNHLVTADPDRYPAPCAPYREQLAGRSMLVKKTRPLPVECIVRGYLSGSFWEAYRRSSVGAGANPMVCGFALPAGLEEAARLPEPLFTPSTKAELGEHDENISLARMEEMLGPELTARARTASLALYQQAAAYARERGIIIADTKFELGLTEEGELILIDEVLTPDSSRFWPAEQYRPGRGQPSFDKQFLRDYLSSLDWPKTPPPPPLPPEIIDKTAARYREALARLTA
ncbi:MAG: phosphoribosylaminoimidazolesuccinocarboxamide synthase [Desulfurivibrio sp.]|nr:phosphoribosylaminoimidazolesuccinocarboxamide synthase [Desulfurivibrio sp.]